MNSKENSQHTSERLLSHFQGGDELAATQLYDRYAQRIIRFASPRIPQILNERFDAEDIAQETLQAFFKLAQLEEVRWNQAGDLWKLIVGIAANKVRQSLDFHSAQKRNPNSEATASEIAYTENDVSIELTDTLDSILKNEKPLLRRVLTLRLAGYQSAEIASQIGRSNRTVRRCLEVLRLKLSENYWPECRWVDHRDCEQPNRNQTSKFRQVRYEDILFLRMIGEGGFAKVYLARDLTSGQYVAVKTIKKKWWNHVTVKRMFAEEFDTLRQLNHPNIVRIIGQGEFSAGGHFLVLEMVRGRAINEVGKSQQQVASWLEQLASALNYIHDQGLIHGDLRFENVLIDNDGSLKLLDFGFSQATSTQHSKQKDWAAFNSMKLDLDKVT